MVLKMKTRSATTCLTRVVLFWAGLCCGYAPGQTTRGQAAIEFGTDIRPILSDNCFLCHGPDAENRQADLRLDTQQGITDAADLISPGNPAESQLLRRVRSVDEDEMMPPADSGKQLTETEKEKLRQWIQQGAQWQDHWAFVPHQRPTAPTVTNTEWCEDEIDYFVMQKLEALGLTPNRPADRNTLIRRLAMDLTGLPPNHELLSRFEFSRSPRWYEELVEELLRSEHFGEHFARYWLDASRYADTHGLHLDNYREMWLYREWVIRAFNDNLSFRDFVIEQLAGDLLPNPSEDQLIASGFNRAHVTTNEGGSIVEEVDVRNVVDRVSTMGTVFMGLTIGCAQCHDHKYDPITQQDFYSLYAFFNSLDGNPMDDNLEDPAPVLKYFTTEQKQQLASWERQRTSLADDIDDTIARFEYSDPLANTGNNPAGQVAANSGGDRPAERSEFVWFDDQIPDGAEKSGEWKSVATQELASASGQSSFASESNGFTQMYFLKVPQPLRVASGDILFVDVWLHPDNPPRQIMLQFNDGSWEHRAYWGDDKIGFGTNGTTSRRRLGDLPATGKWTRLEVPASEVGFDGQRAIQGVAFSQFGGKVHWDRTGAVTSQPQTYRDDSFTDWKNFIVATGASDLPNDLRGHLLNEKLDEAARDILLRKYYLRNIHKPSRQSITQKLERQNELDNQIRLLQDAAPTTLISRERNEPVPAYVLIRGEYDKRGEPVSRRTPETLQPLDESLPKNRLGLAKWLLAEDHPLTSRVAVNRIWQQLFGTGIVATSEDFGAQGDLPSHPDLLDYLACYYIESGWDTKSLVKKIVMSATYRQSTHVNDEKLKRDPDNRYFSRGVRYRWDAEALRDQALAVSGLLVPTLGGPSVKPPQPDGLWFAVGYSRSNTVRFVKDSGHDKVHRRSLYTFWKRTAPPPQMATFDAPSRESCSVRRERTNTPLQALLLMNDPQYIEAARYLAQATLAQDLPDRDRQIAFMYRRALGRDVAKKLMSHYRDNLQRNWVEFSANPDRARALIAIGEEPANETFDPVELAAFTMLANLIMNQDDFISKN
jgi:hypothetical protein